MKKITAIILSILLGVCLLAGCGADEAVENGVESVTSPIAEMADDVTENVDMDMGEDRPITIENMTGMELSEIYISKSGAEEFKDNIISKNGALKDGDKTTVSVKTSNDIDKWDIKAKSKDGKEINYKEVILKDAKRLTLKNEKENPMAEVSKE